MTSDGYVENNTKVRNYPIQYLATGEITPIGVTYLWHRMKERQMQSFLVNTVHDSALGEIHPDEVELFKELGVQSFTGDTYRYLKQVYDIDFNIPLEGEVTLGPHWAETEEWKECFLEKQLKAS